jgi:UDP-N-acetylglucosamine 3-dehydrogenase
LRKKENWRRKMIKIGVIGGGKWGQNHLKDLYKISECNLVGLADNDLSKKELAEQYGARHFSNYKEMLTEVDAVTIVTPTTTHYEIAKNCLEAGKHVFVEKPLCFDPREAEELVNLANQKGLTLSVGYVFRFNPLVKRLKQLLPEIGPLQYISGQYTHSTVPPRKDSGAIFNLAVHLLDVLNHSLSEKPKSVFCSKVNHISEKNEDSAFINLDYGHFIANLEVSCCHPLKRRELWIIGEKEKLHLDLLDQTLMRYPIKVSEEGTSVGESFRDPKIEKTSPLFNELLHFCVVSSSKLNGPEIENNSAEDLLTTKLCLLSIDSANKNEVIKLNQ